MRSIARVGALVAGLGLMGGAVLGVTAASADATKTPPGAGARVAEALNQGVTVCVVAIEGRAAYGGCAGEEPGAFILVGVDEKGKTAVSSPVWYYGAALTAVQLKTDVKSAYLLSVTDDGRASSEQLPAKQI